MNPILNDIGGIVVDIAIPILASAAAFAVARLRQRHAWARVLWQIVQAAVAQTEKDVETMKATNAINGLAKPRALTAEQRRSAKEAAADKIRREAAAVGIDAGKAALRLADKDSRLGAPATGDVAIRRLVDLAVADLKTVKREAA